MDTDEGERRSRSMLSRRDLLRAGFVGAGAAVLHSATASVAPAGATAPAPPPPAGAGLRLEAIQGNSLAGFNKDHQQFLFFGLPAVGRARSWVASMVDQLATCSEVLAFNDLYRRSVKRSRSSAPTAVWVNLALTFSGLQALGVDRSELETFPEAFRQGMRARAGLIGDVGASAPGGWVAPLGSPHLHGVLIVAADSAQDLQREVRAQTASMAGAGVGLLLGQAGRVRIDQPGHEHFGFKDGISQPGIRGVTPAGDDDADEGLPGQELLWPGEFVLGYPTQIPTSGAGAEGENHEPGPVSVSGPAWTADGSYLVFRRLRQDVEGFHAFLSAAAATTGLAPDLVGAKVVGRYRSGAPLERTADQPEQFDPQVADPSVADPGILDETRVNHFEFGDDPDGLLVPRAAHIRKVYPRDAVTPTGGEAATQTHRLIRRGIPFGASYDPSAPADSPTGGRAAYPDDRGLLFLCYQSSIERQFEFVQRRWVNDPDFPEHGDGQDPIISQSSPRKSFTLPGEVTSHRLMMANFVTTTGGEYFLQPSLDALRLLGKPPGPERAR